VTRALALGPVVLALALLGGGCATLRTQEAQPPAKAPGGAEEQRKPLTELDALEHDLAVSEQRLEAQLGRRQRALADSRRRESESGAEESKKTEPAEPSRAEEAPEVDSDEEKPRGRDEAPQQSVPQEEAARTGKVGSPCDMACRALSSMRRSAERICELAGADDERCTRARGRVAAAEERIRRAQCECVDGGSDKLNASLDSPARQPAKIVIGSTSPRSARASAIALASCGGTIAAFSPF
jgi:hypothetical protein